MPILAISAILAIPMNPFSIIASDLGRTVAQAKPLLMKFDNADTSTRPAENKWAKKEILGHLPEEAAKVTCNIGNNKPATLGWIAEDYVAHLKHHLNQILGHTFETDYGK